MSKFRYRLRLTFTFPFEALVAYLLFFPGANPWWFLKDSAWYFARDFARGRP